MGGMNSDPREKKTGMVISRQNRRGNKDDPLVAQRPRNRRFIETNEETAQWMLVFLLDSCPQAGCS